ncbi:MAG: type II toxin-antitoxin system PemK/MazF family toxin [Terriglobales bacterium]
MRHFSRFSRSGFRGRHWWVGSFHHKRRCGPPTIRGVPSEAVLNEEDGMKSPCAVNLHNAVTVSQQRLGRRVAQLSSARMNEVCAALRFSLGCDSN